jgi:hypothetical protein
MSENDPLRAALRAWTAPEPSAALDERVRAGFRAARAPSAAGALDSLRPAPVGFRAARALSAAGALDSLRPAPVGLRAARAPSAWMRFWRARVSVPVPALAAVLLLVAVVWLVEIRPAPPALRQPGLVTRLEATGFQPLPDGVALVEDVRQ